MSGEALSKAERAFFRAFDHGTVRMAGLREPLHTGHGLFSADRVDDGTRLLLEHLPPGAPTRVLDLGCGYGALGLPLAARHPDVPFELLDRDLVACAYAERNARKQGLAHVTVRGSLGVDTHAARDVSLALCNVPARIGEAGLGLLVEQSARVLAPGGVVRVVVIAELADAVRRLGAARRWTLTHVADGARHAVFEVGAQVPPPGDDDAAHYTRDAVTIEGVTLSRPHDASEDPAHLADAVPMLAAVLPRQVRGAWLVWHGGYGGLACALAARGAQVVAADRDLLQLVFTARNARAHGAAVETLRARWLPDVEGVFDGVVAELTAASGVEVARAEARAARARLAAGGTAWLLAPSKLAREAFPDDDAERPRVAAARGAWTVLTARG